MHRSALPWALILAAGVLTFSIQAQQLTRSPYLQVGIPSSIVVRWRTDIPTNSRVIYGTNLANLDRTNQASNTTTEHIVSLSNLTPETTYFYTVGSTTTILSPPSLARSFRTSPAPGTVRPVRVWVLGDPGIGNADQIAVRDAFYHFNGVRNVDAVVTLGDTVYSTGTDEEFQTKFFEVYWGLFQKTVVWPALGNHDTAQSTVYTTSYPYFTNFTLPTAGEAGGAPSGSPHFYSFDYANIHFISLDSTTADRAVTGPMATWLERDLHANTNQWLIAYWHHPPYTKGSHNSDGYEAEMDEMRENILPILESHGVDLVLCGHSHSYERSFLLNGHYGLSTTLAANMVLNRGTGREPQTGAYLKPRGSGLGYCGTVYAVVGSSGWLGGGALNHPVMCVSSNVLGSLVLDIEGDRLGALFLGAAGQTNDYFTILKTGALPATKTHFTVPADIASTLELSSGDPAQAPCQFTVLSPPGFGLLSEFDGATGTGIYTPARGFHGTDSFTAQVSNSTFTGAVARVFISVQPAADTNQNTLSDAWEARHQVFSPEADPDHDGLTNAQEYRVGTDPLDAQSRLLLASIQRNATGTLTLTWHGAAGVRYRLLFRDIGPNESVAGSFTPLVRPVTTEMAPGIPGSPILMTTVDDLSISGTPAHGSRLYRLQVVP